MWVGPVHAHYKCSIFCHILLCRRLRFRWAVRLRKKKWNLKTPSEKFLNNLQACRLPMLNPLCRILWLASGKWNGDEWWQWGAWKKLPNTLAHSAVHRCWATLKNVCWRPNKIIRKSAARQPSTSYCCLSISFLRGSVLVAKKKKKILLPSFGLCIGILFSLFLCTWNISLGLKNSASQRRNTESMKEMETLQTTLH